MAVCRGCIWLLSEAALHWPDWVLSPFTSSSFLQARMSPFYSLYLLFSIHGEDKPLQGSLHTLKWRAASPVFKARFVPSLIVVRYFTPAVG